MCARHLKTFLRKPWLHNRSRINHILKLSSERLFLHFILKLSLICFITEVAIKFLFKMLTISCDLPWSLFLPFCQGSSETQNTFVMLRWYNFCANCSSPDDALMYWRLFSANFRIFQCKRRSRAQLAQDICISLVSIYVFVAPSSLYSPRQSIGFGRRKDQKCLLILAVAPCYCHACFLIHLIKVWKIIIQNWDYKENVERWAGRERTWQCCPLMSFWLQIIWRRYYFTFP